MRIDSKEAYKTFPLKAKLTYKEFNEIVKSTMLKARELMVDGEQIKTPLGVIKVKERKVSYHKPSVNPIATKIKRDEILARGGTIYKPIRSDSGEIIGDNGGEKYLCFSTADSFHYVTTGVNRYIDIEGNKYKFLPFATTIRAVRAKKHSDDLIVLSYAEN